MSSEPRKPCQIYQLPHPPPTARRSKNLDTKVEGLEEREEELFKIYRIQSFKEKPKEDGLV